MTNDKDAGVSDDLHHEITTLVEEHQQALLRYATGILRSPDSARDMVQDAFIKYHRHRLERPETIANPSAWLYRVTHNLCLDHLRKFRRVDALDEDQERVLADQETAGPDARLQRREDVAQAWQCLDVLTERDREVVLLKVMEEKSYKEIAEIMDLSLGNVGFILHSALKKMAAAMKDASA